VNLRFNGREKTEAEVGADIHDSKALASTGFPAES
jgi:hypothetical protein